MRPRFIFRRRRTFRLLSAVAGSLKRSRAFSPETDNEMTDRLAVERGENEGMTVPVDKRVFADAMKRGLYSHAINNR